MSHAPTHAPRQKGLGTHFAPAVSSSDEAGPWDIDFEPWRATIAPGADPPALGVRFAELPIKALAFMLDVLFIQVLVTMLQQVDQFVANETILSSTGGVTDQALQSWVAFGIPGLLILAILGVLQVYFWRVFRASPGQLVVGLYTLRASEGTALSKRRAFVRWLLLFAPMWVVSTAPWLGVVLHYGISTAFDATTVQGICVALPVVWYLIIALTIGINGRGRGLHDRAAASVVVRREGASG